MSKSQEVRTVNCTPDWRGVLGLYLEVIADAGHVNPEIKAELMRMAQAADNWNAHVRGIKESDDE